MPLGDSGTSAGQGLVKMNATPEQKQYLNAAANWVSANLRKESGAAIRPEEMAEEYAKYFPMPLDDEGTIKQKAALRKEAEKGMIAESAGAYQTAFGAKGKKGRKPMKKFPRKLLGKKVRTKDGWEGVVTKEMINE